jgi:hypothetical protein
LGFCQAYSGGESSGGTIVKFKQMSAEEAFLSKKFSKVIERRNLPQSSTTYNPAFELCIEQNYVRSVTPRPECKIWYVKSYEFEKIHTFTSFKAAATFANKSGRGEPYCSSENERKLVFAADVESVDLQYRVDFYTKKPNINDAEYLGSHNYMINYCTKEFMNLPWVEWSVADEFN